jgi:excinuclease UvrABC nuclease subunit
VGPVARTALLRRFGSLAAASEATFAELAAVEGIGKRRAQTLYEHFHPGMRQPDAAED